MSITALANQSTRPALKLAIPSGRELGPAISIASPTYCNTNQSELNHAKTMCAQTTFTQRVSIDRGSWPYTVETSHLPVFRTPFLKQRWRLFKSQTSTNIACEITLSFC